MTSQKKITSVKLPASLHKKVLENVVQNGYGLRGKSKWMVEAIEQFLALNNYHELVDIAADIENLDEIISIRVPEDILSNLDAAMLVVRQNYPGMEGVRSNIIRASIIQKLIRSKSL